MGGVLCAVLLGHLMEAQKDQDGLLFVGPVAAAGQAGPKCILPVHPVMDFAQVVARLQGAAVQQMNPGPQGVGAEPAGVVPVDQPVDFVVVGEIDRKPFQPEGKAPGTESPQVGCGLGEAVLIQIIQKTVFLQQVGIHGLDAGIGPADVVAHVRDQG